MNVHDGDNKLAVPALLQIQRSMFHKQKFGLGMLVLTQVQYAEQVIMLIATKCQQCRLKGRSCGTNWKRRQCGNGSWTSREHQANPSKNLRRTKIMIR